MTTVNDDVLIAFSFTRGHNGSMSVTWKKVGENLVRHSGGTIYLRGRVGGKPIRISLETEDLRIAKIARDATLDRLRGAASSKKLNTAKTIGHALDVLGERYKAPHLKQSSRDYYAGIILALRCSMDTGLAPKTLTRDACLVWWRKTCKGYSAQRANNMLAAAKKLGEIFVESGIVAANPFASMKRVPIPPTKYVVPSLEEMQAIIESIRSQKKARSEEMANLTAFLAFSGCRPAEVRSVEWEHVEEEWITITGGEKLTKNREARVIPINPLLRGVIDRMRYEGAAGALFTVKSPRNALENACERLKLPHMHVYLLRHFFATMAIENAVDPATFAKWLGHRDGGVLAMRRYGHVRDDHSLSMAKRMR